MTESEAIKELKEDISLYDNEITRLDTSIGTPDRNLIDALEMAIRALEEIQQYREVGTVDECREARNKQVTQEVNLRLCSTIDCSDKDCQPTAFDVGKVVGALESEVEWYSTHGVNKDVNRGRIEAFRTAIEYVKAGGKMEGWK